MKRNSVKAFIIFACCAYSFPIALIIIATCFGGCSKKQTKIEIASEPPKREAPIVRPARPKVKPAPKVIPAPNVKPTHITVFFDFDSDLLRPEESLKLSVFVEDQCECRIDGHACVIGTDEYNIGLGLARAIAVQRFLGRGTVNTYGETMCRAFCETIDEAECRECRKVVVTRVND
jgi:hypothetical protein